MPNKVGPFTKIELDYLATQKLGRLATVSANGAPRNNPVGFRYNAELGTIDIIGRDLANSQKFRNVEANGLVALVVDDVASVDPWHVRAIEIRGRAEALRTHAPEAASVGRDLIRIHPTRIVSWGLDANSIGVQEFAGIQKRTVG